MLKHHEGPNYYCTRNKNITGMYLLKISGRFLKLLLNSKQI